MRSQGTASLARHKPVKGKGCDGIWYSERKDGSRVYGVSYKDHTGTWQKELVGPRLDLAKKRAAEIVVKQTTGGVVGSATTTVSDLIPDWEKARDVKPRTIETQDLHVRLHIIPTLGNLKVRDITPANVRVWLNGLKRQDGKPGDLSPSTKAVIFATLSSILEFAVESQLVGSNACKMLGRSRKPKQVAKVPRVLGPGEFEALLAGVSKRRQWLKPMIATGYFAGLRLGEVCGLTKGQVDLDRGVLVIDRQLGKDGRMGTPKGGESREVPITAPLRKVLAAQLLVTGGDDDAPLFPDSNGNHREQGIVDRAFRQARVVLGSEPRAFSFHDLRHSAATTLINMPGAKPKEVQRFLGHKSLTTLGYLHDVEDTSLTDRLGDAFEAAL